MSTSNFLPGPGKGLPARYVSMHQKQIQNITWVMGVDVLIL